MRFIFLNFELSNGGGDFLPSAAEKHTAGAVFHYILSSKTYIYHIENVSNKSHMP
jgi:hypothetical protein